MNDDSTADPGPAPANRRSALKAGRPRSKKRQKKSATKSSSGGLEAPLESDKKPPLFPQVAMDAALRIPKAILEQNAGRGCSDEAAAKFAGVGYHWKTKYEISAAMKYGFLQRPAQGQVEPTDRAKRVLRPQAPGMAVLGYQEALQAAPVLGTVYQHYRGENLPEPQFFANALTDTFGVPVEKVAEFTAIFTRNLELAGLSEKHGERIRLVDVGAPVRVTETEPTRAANDGSTAAERTQGPPQHSCFVMMPFAAPVGTYFDKVYEPAIKKAGLVAVRADNDLFGTGKIMDQVWRGISAAKVLLADLTGRNPNVFYELGLAHAREKPVVLVCSSEADVPFDLRHIRVIYYDRDDPFWGTKLLDKIAENLESAMKNPEEAVFKQAD